VASSCNAFTIHTFSSYVCFRHLLKAHCLIRAAALAPCISSLTNLLLGGPILVLTPCSLAEVMLAVQVKWGGVLFLWRLSLWVSVCLSVCTVTKKLLIGKWCSLLRICVIVKKLTVCIVKQFVAFMSLVAVLCRTVCSWSLLLQSISTYWQCHSRNDLLHWGNTLTHSNAATKNWPRKMAATQFL